MPEFVQLEPSEAVSALEHARGAFPKLSDWQYVNEADGDHLGFCVWGERVLDADTYRPRRFFVTLEMGRAGWSAYLTIGQHAYFWSSADFGDAYLANVGPCASLEEAIAALKAEISSLFAAILGEPGSVA